jgi:hypothetical protein
MGNGITISPRTLHRSFLLHELRLAASLFLLSLAPTLSAPVYNLRGTDIALAGTGQYTSTITSAEAPLPHQGTTNSLGFLFTFRDHPLTKIDVEFNYQYSSFSEIYQSSAGAPVAFGVYPVPIAFHEFTAAYVIRSHRRDTTPFRPRFFLGLGGGEIYFNPSTNLHTQLRPTALADIGLDIPTHNPHLTYRVQGHALFYQAPDFQVPFFTGPRWNATVEPAIGVAFHL